MHPLRAKKLFVMAALEVERMRKAMLTTQAPEGGTQNAAQTLDSLVEQAGIDVLGLFCDTHF